MMQPGFQIHPDGSYRFPHLPVSGMRTARKEVSMSQKRVLICRDPDGLWLIFPAGADPKRGSKCCSCQRESEDWHQSVMGGEHYPTYLTETDTRKIEGLPDLPPGGGAVEGVLRFERTGR